MTENEFLNLVARTYHKSRRNVSDDDLYKTVIAQENLHGLVSTDTAEIQKFFLDRQNIADTVV